MQLGVLLLRAGLAAACILAIKLSGGGLEAANADVPLVAQMSPAIGAAQPADNGKLSIQRRALGLERLKVPFVENRGETDSRVALLARTAAGVVYVGRDGELTYALSRAVTPASEQDSASGRRWTIKERLVDAHVQVRGARPTGTRVRRIVVSEKAGAQASTAYAEADLGEAWPGVRVTVQATGEHAEKFFHVAPGADLKQIRIDVDGVGALTANAQGELIAPTGIGDLLLSAPVAWQEIDGRRRDVSVGYVLLGVRRYGFTLGAHEAQHEVIIDPIVQSTYIGGNSSDQINALTVHPVTGDIYVTGQVESTALFPVSAGALDGTRAGFTDAFIARLPADLKSFTEVTYFGGAGNEAGSDIKVHPLNGDIYVLGSSYSATLPGTAGAAQPAGNTAGTPFVARLTADLQTNVRTTFYGNGFLVSVSSSLLTPGLSLAISPASGTLYIAGTGHATTIPNAAGGAIADHSDYFGYITAIADDLGSFGQGTYLSGSDLGSHTFVQSMTVDPANQDLVVLGLTNSGALPTTPGAVQPDNPGANDQQQAAVIARLPKELTSVKALSYYIDASDHLFPISVMVAGGNTMVGGSVNSGTTALQGMAGGAIATPYVAPSDFVTANGFIVKFTNDLTSIVQGTYVRGDTSAYVTQVAHDPASDSFFAAGIGDLSGLPGLDPGTDTSTGKSFVAQLAPDLKSFIHSTLLSTSNGAVSIARHPINGDLYIAGFGTGAPNAAGGAQPTDQGSNGQINGIITRLTVAGGAPSAGEIAFGSGSYQTSAGSAGVVIVTRTAGSAGAVSVTVTTSDGTATAGTDYTAVTTSVTFADGDTANKTVLIPTAARSGTQGSKTVNVALSAASGGASLGGQSTAVLTIGDASVAPPPPTGSLQFSAAAYSVADNAGAVSINITRSGGTAGAVTVTFATSDGTGHAGTNYTATTQTVAFAAGDGAAKTVSVPVEVMGIVGSSFTVNLSLTGPAGGATLGSPASAVLTINATTPAPVSNTVTVTGKGGGGGMGTIEVLLLGALALRRLCCITGKGGRSGRALAAFPCAALLSACGILGAARPATADSPGFYAGFGLGQVRSDASAADLARQLDAAGFPGATVSIDDRKLAGKAYAGISFNSYIALEAAYVDLNRVRTHSTAATADIAGFVAAVTAIHPYSARGGSLSALVSLPVVGGLSVFARGGGFAWHGEINAAIPGSDADSSRKTGLAGVMGAGIEFAFTKQLALRAEWERYLITRDSMDLAVIGVRCRF
jgi:hypothetical protein